MVSFASPMQPRDNVLTEDLDSILDRTRERWEQLRNQRIFITGGTGFVGSWLLESFLWANRRLQLNANAVVLTRDPSAFADRAPWLASHRSLELVAGDVRHFEFPPGRFRFVIHAATSPRAAAIRDTRETHETIVEGTRRALDMGMACGATRFLFTSSGAVYGAQPPSMERLEEDFTGELDRERPAFAYAQGKREAEVLCRERASDGRLAAVIARCFTFVGPYLPLNDRYAVGNFVSARVRRGPIRVQGDGAALRSFLYAGDLAGWLWELLFRGESGRAYNVGSEDAVSIRELANIVAASGDAPPAEVIMEGQPASGVRPERYIPSIRRITQELGLAPTVSLSDAVDRMVRWNMEQR